MRHRIHKIKFHSGSDSNQMILKKMLRNFFLSSHLVTTEKRAKILKSSLDRIVGKTRVETESNRNYVLRYITEPKIMKALFSQVGPAVKEIAGGYVRIVRKNQRENDASMMVRVEWAHPVIIDWGEKKPAEKVVKDEKAPTVTKKPKKITAPAEAEVKADN